MAHMPNIRHIVLDTETTGLSSATDRIIEITCLELRNFVTTGDYFQAYIDPQQPVSPDAQAVHGLSNEFLSQYPPFHAVADKIVEFIDQSPLIIHNAPFDLAFLHAEFKRLNRKFPQPNVIDTLTMARKKFPGSPASLDALCKRFNISLAGREKHGALIDCQLLANVYIELLGGAQQCISFSKTDERVQNHTQKRVSFPQRSFELSASEKERHDQLIQELKGAIWKKYHENVD